MRDYSLVTSQDLKSTASEAFRTLRTNLQFANAEQNVKKILFTSTGAAEGKSSTVANLAISLAQSGKHVLIIDADLRLPSQHKVFDIPNKKGLTDLLLDEVPILTYVTATDIENLDLLLAGPIPLNPSELLGSKRMKHLLEEFANLYDFILIDSPPTIAVTDSSILAQFVDGVILVLAAGTVNREYALAAKNQLEKVGAKIIGTVLNKVELKKKHHYYYYYEDKH